MQEKHCAVYFKTLLRFDGEESWRFRLELFTNVAISKPKTVQSGWKSVNEHSWQPIYEVVLEFLNRPMEATKNSWSGEPPERSIWAKAGNGLCPLNRHRGGDESI